MKTLQSPPPTYRRTLLGGFVSLWRWLSARVGGAEPDIGPFAAFIESLEES